MMKLESHAHRDSRCEVNSMANSKVTRTFVPAARHHIDDIWGLV